MLYLEVLKFLGVRMQTIRGFTALVVILAIGSAHGASNRSSHKKVFQEAESLESTLAKKRARAIKTTGTLVGESVLETQKRKDEEAERVRIAEEKRAAAENARIAAEKARAEALKKAQDEALAKQNAIKRAKTEAAIAERNKINAMSLNGKVVAAEVETPSSLSQKQALLKMVVKQNCGSEVPDAGRATALKSAMEAADSTHSWTVSEIAKRQSVLLDPDSVERFANNQVREKTMARVRAKIERLDREIAERRALLKNDHSISYSDRRTLRTARDRNAPETTVSSAKLNATRSTLQERETQRDLATRMKERELWAQKYAMMIEQEPKKLTKAQKSKKLDQTQKEFLALTGIRDDYTNLLENASRCYAYASGAVRDAERAQAAAQSGATASAPASTGASSGGATSGSLLN